MFTAETRRRGEEQGLNADQHEDGAAGGVQLQAPFSKRHFVNGLRYFIVAPLRCATACGARKNALLSFTQRLPLQRASAPRAALG